MEHSQIHTPTAPNQTHKPALADLLTGGSPIVAVSHSPSPTQQPEPADLTLQEKQALLNHWLARGKPIITLDHALWFNLEAILYATDPFLAEKRRQHAPELRRLLNDWNNKAEVQNEATEVRPRQPAL